MQVKVASLPIGIEMFCNGDAKSGSKVKLPKKYFKNKNTAADYLKANYREIIFFFIY